MTAVRRRRRARWRVDGQHLLRPARYLPSPHADARPGGAAAIDTLVIHAISLPPGEFGAGWIDRFFAGSLPAEAHPYFAGIAGLRVSAHCCIFRDGSLHQYVPFDARAWHAGVSCFDGRERVNDFSIGIELEGDDDSAFSEAQYDTLLGVIPALQAAYPGIGRERIVGHSDIAPGRKTDPGPHFDWSRLLSGLRYGA